MPLATTNVSPADAVITAGSDTEASPEVAGPMTVGYGLKGVSTLTNGAGAPSTPAQVAVQVRPKGANSDWRYWAGPFTGRTDSNGVASFAWEVPIGWEEARIVGFGNAGNNVTMSNKVNRIDSL